ncbi:MFS transporter [Spirillospora sp. CA-294931]|uniref:MFS transporter n=1 Tax=Spirillospora sp. CA-294931 TaxID=3240042 RepID=UPI003D8FB1A8
MSVGVERVVRRPEAGLARRLYVYAFLEDFVLLYPVYAVLFAGAGLSAAQISSLFVIWSVTAVVFEVPSGVWADVVSRRRLLMVAPVLCGAGFGLWTVVPAYWAFAVGFVLWGLGSALRSGTMQALVFEELARVGASGSYAGLMGRSEAVAALAVMVASVVAAPVLGVAGFGGVGAASVGVCVLGVVAGWSMPETRGPRGEGEVEPSLGAVVREGWGQVRGSAAVRGALVLSVVVTGAAAMDEYVPLLVVSMGVAGAGVPLLVGLVTAGDTVGGWLAGRGVRWFGPVVLVSGLCLAAGSVGGSAWGLVLVAVAFGGLRWAMTAADARLQERIGDGARATVTSLAGLGSEVVAVLVFAGYGVGSLWAGPGVLFVVASVPFVVVALVVWRGGGSTT